LNNHTKIKTVVKVIQNASIDHNLLKHVVVIPKHFSITHSSISIKLFRWSHSCS